MSENAEFHRVGELEQHVGLSLWDAGHQNLGWLDGMGADVRGHDGLTRASVPNKCLMTTSQSVLKPFLSLSSWAGEHAPECCSRHKSVDDWKRVGEHTHLAKHSSDQPNPTRSFVCL